MISLLLFVALSQASQPQEAATPQPTTPAACVKAARDFIQTEQRALKQITGDAIRKIEADKVANAQKCAAQFKVATHPEADLANLIALYGEAAQPELAKAALERALASKTLTATVRGNVLAQAVLTGLREPKSAERNARLEKYVDELDRLEGDLLDVKIGAHARMNGFYRGDDIDDGIIKHSTWLIERALTFTPEQRKLYGSTIVSAHINMAEAVAGRGDNPRAMTLLKTAKAGWSDIPSTNRMVDPVLERYALVDTPAAPIAAPRWLNAPANTTITMPGDVTLLEFTAHWCGPCKESYPGVKRLLAKYGSRGFRVVLATELYGYFGNERPLTPEAEFERDREYWAHEGLAVPVAVGDPRPIPVRRPDGSYAAIENPNDAAYKVGGIPQIQIIDKKGVIRLIMVGYDDVNE
ncbi:MAG TPA: TlpA disulfide reductase family protein, partial [Vicinamibacterales bacterium]|nr:TlpA disulfide reductase family protein [Vicinamibacterales bacterium]